MPAAHRFFHGSCQFEGSLHRTATDDFAGDLAGSSLFAIGVNHIGKLVFAEVIDNFVCGNFLPGLNLISRGASCWKLRPLPSRPNWNDATRGRIVSIDGEEIVFVANPLQIGEVIVDDENGTSETL